MTDQEKRTWHISVTASAYWKLSKSSKKIVSDDNAGEHEIVEWRNASADDARHFHLVDAAPLTVLVLEPDEV